MKKGISLLLTMMLGLSLVGCNQSKEYDTLLDKVQGTKQMVVAMEGSWAPWTYHNEKDELVGYDVEVAKAIAKKLGVEPVFKEGSWDGLFQGLDSRIYDVVINGVDYTEERAEKYDFTVPYAYDYTGIVVKQDNNTIHTFEDLKGKQTANSLASTYQTLAERYGATVKSADTIDKTMDLVINGQVDATLNAESSIYYFLKEKKDANVKVVAYTKEPNKICIPTPKGEYGKSFREAVDKAIEELRNDGTLTQLSEKYFGKDISKEK